MFVRLRKDGPVGTKEQSSGLQSGGPCKDKKSALKGRWKVGGRAKGDSSLPVSLQDTGDRLMSSPQVKTWGFVPSSIQERLKKEL